VFDLQLRVLGLSFISLIVVGSALAQNVVGKIAASRSASHSATPTSPNAGYVAVKSDIPVRNGDGVRTSRRGFAQIAFNDKSVLRLSELTELIVQDSVSLRRLQLAKGALWVRVTKGSNTAIQTPVATATVRGTELLIDELGNLAVREGSVELEANGFTIEVFAGEIAGIGPDGRPFKKGVKIPTEENVDAFELGVPELWWRRLKGLSDLKGDDWTPALALLPLLFIGDGNSRDRQTPVPEPLTLLTMGAGAGYLVLRNRRRSR
jgi:hypothetical protein